MKINRLYRIKFDVKKQLYTIEISFQCGLWPFWRLYKETVPYPGNGDFPLYYESEEGVANKILKLEIENDPEKFPEFFV